MHLGTEGIEIVLAFLRGTRDNGGMFGDVPLYVGECAGGPRNHEGFDRIGEELAVLRMEGVHQGDLQVLGGLQAEQGDSPFRLDMDDIGFEGAHLMVAYRVDR